MPTPCAGVVMTAAAATTLRTSRPPLSLGPLFLSRLFRLLWVVVVVLWYCGFALLLLVLLAVLLLVSRSPPLTIRHVFEAACMFSPLTSISLVRLELFHGVLTGIGLSFDYCGCMCIHHQLVLIEISHPVIFQRAGVGSCAERGKVCVCVCV